jgi:ferredoxin
LKDGYDVQLTDLGARYLAEVASEKGEAAVLGAANLFRTAMEGEVSERKRLELAARNRFGEETCHFGAAMRRVSTGRVPDALWSKMSDWCLECGGCNLICPTCYCFSVKDLGRDGMWVRCRIWDSCQYAAFTLEASGHNPRAERKQRMKRRFFHKVSAQYYLRDGVVGCVGCGRCIKVCLGTTDMPTVVTAIRKGKWHE